MYYWISNMIIRDDKFCKNKLSNICIYILLIYYKQNIDFCEFFLFFSLSLFSLFFLCPFLRTDTGLNYKQENSTGEDAKRRRVWIFPCRVEGGKGRLANPFVPRGCGISNKNVTNDNRRLVGKNTKCYILRKLFLVAKGSVWLRNIM